MFGRIMSVQFTGTLQYQLQLSEVLRRIMEGNPDGLSALTLTNDQNGQNGQIFFIQSQYVCGAVLKDARGTQIETGYGALKILCGMISANFQYLTEPQKYLENVDLTLNIEIAKILEYLPRLPDDSSSSTFHPTAGGTGSAPWFWR